MHNCMGCLPSIPLFRQVSPSQDGADLSTQQALPRRTLVSGLLAAFGVWAAPRAFGAPASTWLPYADSKTIQPQLSDVGAYKRIEPSYRNFETGHTTILAKTREGQTLRAAEDFKSKTPRAYTLTAQAQGFDPRILYAVALQESVLKFGTRTLPYPWTLCVQGKPERHASYALTLASLRNHVSQGITNVDCGVMQVNWYWHKDQLVSLERAVDPYPNLAVGAQILGRHFADSGDWRTAIARYHAGVITPQNSDRAQRYAQSVLRRMASMGLDSTGRDVTKVRHA